MKLEIINLTDEEIDESLLKDIANKTKEVLKTDGYFVSLVLTTNEHIHEINKKYRGIDRETDVISFAFLDDTVSKSNEDLGEIYISIDKAHSQAKDYNHSFKREISFLFVHGLLHLLGYDHMNEKDEKEMFSLQEEILESLNISR